MTKYLSMCQTLIDQVRFRDDSPVGAPDGSPFDAGKLQQVVRANQGPLPPSYRSGYATPLVTALPELVIDLQRRLEADRRDGMSEAEALADVKSIADSLVGAVQDWGVAPYTPALRRFEAVVSNLYRSFLSDEQRARVSLPLIEAVPPLVTFAPTAEAGPFTWPADAVNDFIHAPIGVVSLPGSYREHPLIWPALAHETGGHDVLHADPGLLDELAQAVRNGLPRGAGALWASWMDEAASDVYGLLNIGPAFAVSLAAFFSALEATDPRDPSRPGTIGTTLFVQGSRLLDPHPVDLLRVHLAMGAVGALSSLAPGAQHDWLTLLDSIAEEAAGGADTIDVFDVAERAIVQRLSLSTMAQEAKAAGKIIATEQLSALGGHSIQEIETWSDADEAAALHIRDTAAAGHSIVALGDDAQLLAGTTMALFDDATKYAALTTALEAALDDSFARDPVFGIAAPHFMFMRGPRRRLGKAYSRTPTPPSLPMLVRGSGDTAR